MNDTMGDGPLAPETLSIVEQYPEIAKRAARSPFEVLRSREEVSSFLRPQAGDANVPDDVFNRMQALWSLVKRYYNTPGAHLWTHTELEAAVKEVAEEHQVNERWVRSLFGKIILYT